MKSKNTQKRVKARMIIGIRDHLLITTIARNSQNPHKGLLARL
jgi:hypothetical protein